MLWQIIFLVTGILSLIYYSAICIALKKWDSTFSRFWLATGIVGIAGSALIRLYGMPCIVEAMIGISVCFLLIAEIKIIKGMHRNPLGKRKEHFEEDTKTGSATRWIIVLGAQVRGRKITGNLIADVDTPVGIVSNNFHVYRGCVYAKRAGFKEPFPIPASCHPLLFPNYFVRECFAVWKLWLKKY